jgi:hypothetical protein
MLGATWGTSLFGQQQSAFVTAFPKAAQHCFGNIMGNELDEWCNGERPLEDREVP